VLSALASCAANPEAEHTLADNGQGSGITPVTASSPPRPTPAHPAEDRQRATYRIKFVDTSDFDGQLGDRLLEKYAMVVVRPIAPFTVNKIPERLDKWFYAVKQRGGKVELEELPPETLLAKRSVFSFLVDFLIRAFDLIRERVKYDGAQDYDVKIAYRTDTGRVERVTFIRRS
jgi:hypothetical protein